MNLRSILLLMLINKKQLLTNNYLFSFNCRSIGPKIIFYLNLKFNRNWLVRQTHKLYVSFLNKFKCKPQSWKIKLDNFTLSAFQLQEKMFSMPTTFWETPSNLMFLRLWCISVVILNLKK